MDLNLQGSLEEIFFQIGQKMAQAIHWRIGITHVAAQAAAERARLEPLQKEAAARFPEIFQGLRALADGSGASFEEIFALNVLHSHGCTTLVRWNGGRPLVGHNEDGAGFELPEHCAWVQADGAPGRGIASFLYPGELWGTTHGWNRAGVWYCNNAVPPTPQARGKLPPCFPACDALWRARSVERRLRKFFDGTGRIVRTVIITWWEGWALATWWRWRCAGKKF